MISEPIKIIEVDEHEDGSATVHMDLDSETYADIFSYGFVALVRKAMENDQRRTRHGWPY